MGETAYHLLTPGQRLEVMAVLRQAIYLRTDESELLWIAGDAGVMHRRCLKVHSTLPGWIAGESLTVQDRCMKADMGCKLEFDGAAVWYIPLLPSGRIVQRSSLPGILTGFFRHFVENHRPAGLGALIPAMLRVAKSQDEDPILSVGNDFTGKTWPIVARLLLAVFGHETRGVMRNANRLVGQGEGLTPSGDDFLGGFFFALQMLRHVYPDADDLADWNYLDFIHKCQPLTNTISYTFLKDHADGYGLEPLHLFANALFEGEPLEQLEPHAEWLAAVGHSTGWDTLTGFLAGMCITFAT